MAKFKATASPTSVILRVKLMDSSATDGSGLAGLTSASAGLIISTIGSDEATPTVYTQAAGNIETIATLGTYAAPTGGKCRFKEVDATNHPGMYEIQFADARYASVAQLQFSVSGASNLAEYDAEVDMTVGDANVTQINGGLTTGYNAVFKLKQLDVQNSAGDAISAVSTGSNGRGIRTLGHGTGDGFLTEGGNAADGFHPKGGAGGGDAIFAEGTGANDGIRSLGGPGGGDGGEFVGQAGGFGFKGQGHGVGKGIYGGGGTTGDGIGGSGGSGGGHGANFGANAGGYNGVYAAANADSGVKFVSLGGNADGLELVRSGTGKDISATEIDGIKTKTDGLPADPTSQAIMSDLMFTRDVVTRHANQKPSQYTAGTGGNQLTINTTQDGSGNTETESIAP